MADPIKTLKAKPELGRGSFGVVYQWDDDTAIKYVKTPHQRFDEHLRELAVAAMCKKHQQILKTENSRYIIGIKAIAIYKCGYTISMDLGSKSLIRLIRKRSWRADKSCIKALIDLRRGIEFLHSQYIWHRDITPGNIISNHKLERFQLCDFGQARPFGKDIGIEDSSRGCRTTYHYAHPKLLCRRKAVQCELGCAADFYALGASILHALFPDVFNIDIDSESEAFDFHTSDVACAKLHCETLDFISNGMAEILFVWLDTTKFTTSNGA